MTEPRKCILFKYSGNDGIGKPTEPDGTQISIPEAASIIVRTAHLSSATSCIAECLSFTTAFGFSSSGTYSMTGDAADMKPLHRARRLLCKPDEIQTVLNWFVITQDASFQEQITQLTAAFLGQACLVMLLACGVTNSIDLIAGLQLFQKLEACDDPAKQFGIITHLLEVYLTATHGMSFKDLCETRSLEL